MNEKLFVEIPVAKIGNAPKLIGEDWMLITVKDDTKPSGANAMTASWGFMGYIWKKNVAVVFIRPERYTYALSEAEDRFALCFFGTKSRDFLKTCGVKSGRDMDKIAECGFHSQYLDGVPVISEAELAIVGKKVYIDDRKKENFIDSAPLSYYESDGLHRVYVLEIEKVYAKDGGEYYGNK